MKHGRFANFNQYGNNQLFFPVTSFQIKAYCGGLLFKSFMSNGDVNDYQLNQVSVYNKSAIAVSFKEKRE